MSDLISRKAAIEAMEQRYCDIERVKKRPVTKGEQAIFLDMRGVVRSLPSWGCRMSDLISRQDAIKAVWKLDKDANEYVVDDAKEIHGYCTAIGVCVGELSALPSADITETETCQRCQDLTDTILNRQGDEIKRLKAEARPTGEWIFNTSTSNGKSWNVCSECGESIFHPANFCPNCGARMLGEDGEA